MTAATLGFQIDSSQASSAAVDLDKLTAAATRTQAAADRLEADAASLGTALGRAGDGATKAKPAVESLGRSFGSQDEHVRSFRMEVERLTLKYQPLAQATRQYEATVAEIGRAHKVGAISAQQMTTALDAERMAFERLKTSATTAGAAVKAANANTRAGANGSFATANVAAQFQDIAVTSAMGMSPLQIALQQGTQLSAVLGPMGAAGAVKGLGAAFLSVISPVSLLTIGLVAGTAALIQYFSTAEDGTDKTSKLFEEQNDTIRRAAELWGDAAPALKAYVDELDRADKITQGRAAGEILAGRSLDGLAESLQGIKREFGDANRALSQVGADPAFIRDFGAAFGDLRAKLDDGTASIGDVNEAQRALADAVANYGVKEVLRFQDAFDSVTAAIYRGVEAAQKARTAWIAAIAGGTTVQDILSGSTFTEGGKTYSPNDFVPINAPRPSSRPLNELDGDPGPTNIMNSDGRLTGVPIPGQKPNTFELEKEADAIDDVTKAYRRAQEAQADFWLDLSFQERQAGRSPTDQKIASTLTRYGFNENLQSPEANALRQQMRGEEAKGLFKDFFNGAYQEAWSNGGKIGDALGKSALNAAQKATEKAWDAIFDKLATGLSNWLTGKSGGASASAAPGVVSNLLGGAANDNKSFAAPVGAVTRAALPPTTDIGNYIAKAAAARGIDPDIALRVAKSEGGLDSWNLQSNYVKNGVREPSFGPFQLYKGGGLGNKFMDKTGLDPANAAAGPAGVDFALDEAKKSGWGAWYGAKKAGIGDFEGIGKSAETATAALDTMAGASTEATKGLGSLASGLASGVGGAKGLGSVAGGFDWSSLFSSSWKPNTTLGAFLGANANGTDNWRGGPTMVGERGPELLNLPSGSGVVSNHKLMSALAANNNGGQGGGIAGIRLFVEKDGNWNAKVVSLAKGPAKQASAQAVGQYSKQQTRGGFGDTQSVYASDKG
jgi:hypothetical protein